MITEFIKEHKKLCIIILIAIIIILIIVYRTRQTENTAVDEVVETTEASEPTDISSQLEDDITSQTVYNGYIYGVE